MEGCRDGEEGGEGVGFVSFVVIDSVKCGGVEKLTCASITGSIYADVTRKCLSLSPVSGDIVEFERELAGALAQIGA